MENIVEKLKNNTNCTDSELISLLNSENEYLRLSAVKTAKRVYSNRIYIRGLIEISNYCKNDCFYCGIRKSNSKLNRYRLTKDDILLCCKNGYSSGFRTFVLQGGEDLYYTDDITCDIIESIKKIYPDCAVTLSLGEKSKETYRRYFNAGADRYLLRHETADSLHYSKLHPKIMNLENRIECLHNLKEIGFQVGCGFMVGSPFQTDENIISDIKFIKDFKPHMVGIGPFIPHNETPFKDFKQGNINKVLNILSIVRLMLPAVLLPSTTALASLSENGRTAGILAGANVIMPNLSPKNNRKDYSLYNNKKSFGSEGAEEIEALKEEMKKIEYEIVSDRGDYKENV